jgi:hypothetical protein
MNAPVLNTQFLPVGPARAAIVVFAEEYGGIGLAIGVRSNEGGQVVVFRNQEPIDASTSVADALEPALTSAEQMGFLFDEDMVESVPGGQGRAQALVLWGRLMGELRISKPVVVAEPTVDPLSESATGTMPIEATVPELLLDDIAPPAEPISLEDEMPAEVPAASSPPREQLSKFRNAPDPASSQTQAASELGRIPLVRVCRDGTKHVPFLARLLASF